MLAERQREAMTLILEGATPSDVDRVIDRFRHADGSVRDERSRGARHRLVRRDIRSASEHPRHPLRRGPAGAKDRRRASTITTRSVTPGRPPHVEKIIRDFAESRPRTSSSARFRIEEILERCIYPMINEGAKDPRRGQGPARIRHRYRLDLRLRLARVSRRPDVLCGYDRARRRCWRKLEARFRRKHGEAFKPAALLGKNRRRGQELHAMIPPDKTRHPTGCAGHLLPEGEGKRALSGGGKP